MTRSPARPPSQRNSLVRVLGAPRRAFVAVALAAAVATSIDCTHGQPSASTSGSLDIVLQSDMALPKDMDHVSLHVMQGGKSLFAMESDLGAQALLLPATFEVKGTSDPSPATIQAVGYLNHLPRVERDAITPIPTARTGVLRIALDYLCVGTAQTDADGGVSSTCPDGMTCSNGACVTALVPPEDVPAVATEDASVDAAASTCFDVATCFASAMPIGVDPASCVATVPAGTNPTQVNVALQFPPPGPGVCAAAACWVSLTGWTLSGTTLQLPTAACQGAAARGATIVLSTRCYAEGPSQTICGPGYSVTTPATEPPSGPVQTCGDDTQPCGRCGTQTRTCMNGVDGPWGACTGEGPCSPDDTQSCGSGGTQTCGVDCQWAACGCTTDLLTCGPPGTCVSPADVHTCGTCANDCTALPHVSGPTTCTTGACAFPSTSCAAGWGDCDGDPTNGCETPLNTASHCGACGTACTGAGAICDTSGATAKCGTTCTGAICGTTCVNENTDPMHCGGCGTACAMPTHGQATCAGTKCGVGCNSGYTACPTSAPATCVDTTSDAANCGSCGHACPGGSSCQKGVCTCSGAASEACGNCGTATRTCSDGTWSAWSICSSQGACAANATEVCEGNGTATCGTTCAWGACVCNAGYTLCGSTCVNEKTDSANCGSCMHACATGVACQAGVCQCTPGSRPCGTCGAGTQTSTCNADGSVTWQACSGGSNLQTDNANCGSCGNACTSGVTCTSGVCACSGSSSTSCVQCGTETRSCNPNGTWSAWSMCQNQGCTAYTAQSCSVGGGTGTQSCQPSSCSWSSCCNPAPTYTLQSASAVLDPATGLQWQTAGSGVVSYATAMSHCTSLGGSWHVPTFAQLDSLLKGGQPAVDTCAFSIPFDRTEGSTEVSLNYYINRFWTSNTGTSSTFQGCTTYQDIIDLFTGTTNWGGCPGQAVAQVLCVE